MQTFVSFTFSTRFIVSEANLSDIYLISEAGGKSPKSVLYVQCIRIPTIDFIFTAYPRFRNAVMHIAVQIVTKVQ